MTTDKTPKQLLTEARDLIADPGHWIQNATAKTQHGHHCDPTSQHATLFCASGALLRAADLDEQPIAYKPQLRHYLTARRLLRDAASHIHSSGNISYVNDRYTHEDVVTMFNRAIKKAD